MTRNPWRGSNSCKWKMSKCTVNCNATSWGGLCILFIVYQLSSLWISNSENHTVLACVGYSCISLVPRYGGGEGERMPDIYSLRMCLIATQLCGNHVHMPTYVYFWHHEISMLIYQLVFCSSEFYIMLFYAFWWLGTLTQSSRNNILPPLSAWVRNISSCCYSLISESQLLPLPTKYSPLYPTV